MTIALPYPIIPVCVILLGGLTGIAQPLPDLKWEPEPFRYAAGASQRYIDYEAGSDSNPGTMAAPWKHHPWDPEAGGNAATSEGVHTYVFKKGITYRGRLVADESGEDDNPIRLTVNPEWGQGEAEIAGSIIAGDNWKRYEDTDGLPFPKSSSGKIWCVDMDIDFVPQALWAIDDGEIVRIPIAREPDWSVSDPDDPRSEWWEWTDHKYTGAISVDTTEGFGVGDKLWTIEQKEESKELYIIFEADKIRQNQEASAIEIIGFGEGVLKVECSDYVTFQVSGKTITNGTAFAKAASDIINRNHRVMDTENLVRQEPDYYEGAMVWTEQLSYAGYGHPAIIEHFSPEEQSVVMLPLVPWLEGQKRSPSKYCRYYLENKPQFLDSPGEFYFENKEDRSRLYLRLPGDANPNDTRIEIARHPVIIEILDRSHIEISGLTLRFENIDDWLATNERVAAIAVMGNASNITVSHCKIEHVIKGMSFYPLRDGDVGDYIELSDSEIRYTDHNAVALRYGLGAAWGFLKRPSSEPMGRLIHVKVLRNNLYEIGNRPPPGDASHALEVRGGQLVEIAYNVIDRTYASGIQAMNNRWSGESEKVRQWESPLNRSLVHHNKVTNSMLQANDWGSIASWGVGPSYVYSNISGNSIGHRYSFYREGWPSEHEFNSFFSISNKNFGGGFYFDQMTKGFCFNNIAWGINNNIEDRIYNTYGYFQTSGPLNHIFQNTFYRFAVGTHVFYNHFRCLGNLYLDTGYSHLIHSADVGGPTAYTNNAFHGDVKAFALGGGKASYGHMNEWRQMLEKSDPLAFGVGILLEEENVLDAAGHDFRLKENAPGIDQGVKVFVPWGLYKVVGEWHFYKDRADPSRIIDEHVFLNDEWITYSMYDKIPRHDLTAHHVLAANYETGLLEDWVEGALNLDGKDQYCSIADASTKANYAVELDGESVVYPGEKRVSLDAGTENFLIEVVFKTRDNLTGGALVSKGDAQLGYHLVIDGSGGVQFNLGFGKDQYVATGLIAVNDDQWHHLVAEVDRDNKKVSIYVDGELYQVKEQGELPKSISLANQDDLTVGRLSTEEAGFFRGSIDYLRLSQGSLTDAETTIEELYEWQFDGPFLKDFYGNEPTGAGRDIGALESF
jgi:hypothetical protein